MVTPTPQQKAMIVLLERFKDYSPHPVDQEWLEAVMLAVEALNLVTEHPTGDINP